jgi:hypothetical protein
LLQVALQVVLEELVVAAAVQEVCVVQLLQQAVAEA